MSAPWVSSYACLHLKGTKAPTVETRWQPGGDLSMVYEATGMQTLGFYGTPQEIRLALAKGLAAVDRAVAERERAAKAGRP